MQYKTIQIIELKIYKIAETILADCVESNVVHHYHNACYRCLYVLYVFGLVHIIVEFGRKFPIIDLISETSGLRRIIHPDRCPFLKTDSNVYSWGCSRQVGGRSALLYASFHEQTELVQWIYKVIMKIIIIIINYYYSIDM